MNVRKERLPAIDAWLWRNWRREQAEAEAEKEQVREQPPHGRDGHFRLRLRLPVALLQTAARRRDPAIAAG